AAFCAATLGTTTNTLLHSSPVPIVLTPAGYDSQQPLSRITGMFGPRPDAKHVVSQTVTAAQAYTLPARLVSLVVAGRDHSLTHRPEPARYRFDRPTSKPRQ